MSEPYALVLAGTDEPSAEMIRGVAAVLIPAGWIVTYHSERASGPLSEEDLRRFDAVIVSELASERTREAVLSCRHVIGMRMDLKAEGFASVVVDEEAVGRAAGEHLIANGLGQVTGFAMGKVSFAERRFAGLREAVTSAGLRWVDPFVLQAGRFSAVDSWLGSLPAPMGVLAGCDEWGRYLIQRAHELGYRIPEQLEVVGVDNYSLACDVAATPLSSVSIPWREMGRCAGMLLLEEIKRRAKAPPLVAIPPAGVVVRRSSDLLHVEDPIVAQTLKVIRAAAHRPISVPEILRQVPASRRELEKAFKRTVGRTIMQEVRRVHVDLAKRLLAMTDLEMPEVARRSGFASAEKLSVHFRKEAGMTPSDYRRSRPAGRNPSAHGQAAK